MFSLRTLARVSATAAAIGVAGVALPGQAAGPPSFDVIVDNPVTLNPNTPNPVTITNPPGAPPSTVNIGNPADIAKAQGIQHPTQLVGSCDFDGGNICNAQIDVPANQRLVIEYASTKCDLEPSNLLVSVDVFTTAAGVFAQHQLTTDHSGVLIPIIAERIMSFGQKVRLYADPGSTILLQVLSTDVSHLDCGFALAGQAIDVP